MAAFIRRGSGVSLWDAFLGHRAYENCKQLTQVDISRTKLDLLHMHTFSHCQSLQKVTLPPSLREIRAEAFVGCTALNSLALPALYRTQGIWGL